MSGRPLHSQCRDTPSMCAPIAPPEGGSNGELRSKARKRSAVLGGRARDARARRAAHEFCRAEWPYKATPAHGGAWGFGITSNNFHRVSFREPQRRYPGPSGPLFPPSKKIQPEVITKQAHGPVFNLPCPTQGGPGPGTAFLLPVPLRVSADTRRRDQLSKEWLLVRQSS